jgi:hypothetical protein
MPTKITRSAKPAPKPPHKPDFPVRKPALVRAADASVAPINTGKVQAVYTRQGWLMWGIMGLCMAIGIFFWEQINSGFQWVRLEANERVYTELGKDVCKRPLMTIAERDCENCFSTEQEILIERYEAQARAHNLWQAESCIPLM